MSSLTSFFNLDPFSEFDRLFDDAFNARFWPSTSSVEVGQHAKTQPLASFSPRRALFATLRSLLYSQMCSFSRFDLYESMDSNTVVVTFELPGLRPEDVAIDIHNNRLTVSGECTTPNSHEEVGYAVRERLYGEFSRTLQLPFGTKVCQA